MSEEKLTAAQVEEKLRRGPYHQWLGLKVVSVGEGEIELTATWREEWVVNPDRNYTHGGILAALGVFAIRVDHPLLTPGGGQFDLAFAD